MKAKRRDPTERVKREIRERQNKVCFIDNCNEPIAIFEHWTPVAMGNAEYPDCGLCKSHAAAKTKRDVAAIAKVKRLKKKAAGEVKKKKPLRTRGFDKSKTRGFDGKVRER